MSHRHEQLESTLKRALQQVLARGLQDPRTNGTMITVTGLTIARDLKNATALISVFPEERQKLAMHAIRHAAAHIRHEVSELVAMRAVPLIAFDLDTQLKKQVELLSALRQVEQERQRPGPDAARSPADDRTAGNNPSEAPTP